MLANRQSRVFLNSDRIDELAPGGEGGEAGIDALSSIAQTDAIGALSTEWHK